MYGFTQMESLIDGVEKAFRYEEDEFVVMQISKATAGEGFSEKEGHFPGMSQWDKWLSSLQCKYLLLVWREQEELCLLMRSRDGRIRSQELMDHMLTEFGLIKGDGACAVGRISMAVLQVQMAEVEMKDSMDYLLYKLDAYYHLCDWIDAGSFVDETLLDRCKVYGKKRVKWAYVKTTDIVSPGTAIHLKSLENEGGMNLVAQDDLYIMIGFRGEIYHITKDKFSSTYEESDEALDIIEQMLEFLPEVQVVETKEYITLDLIAKICYPKQGTDIYALPLERRTKVFPADGSGEYYLGLPGDFLAIRRDDVQDVYIIQKDIFMDTYEEI